MTAEGVDHSTKLTDPNAFAAALNAAGKGFVGRYIGPGGTTKRLAPQEVAAYHGHGIAIMLIAEGGAADCLLGYAKGVEHAKLALANARQLGAPDSVAIYFCADTDVTAGTWPAVREYLRGAASVVGLARVGLYGEYDVMAWADRDDAATYLCQCFAWSAGRWYAGNHVEQYRAGVSIGGVDCDLDRAKQADFGQWRSPVAPPIPPTEEDDDMWTITAPSKTIYLVPGDLANGRPVAIPQSSFTRVQSWWANGVRSVTSTVEPRSPDWFVAALDAPWPPPEPPVEVALSDEDLAKIAEAAKEGAQAGTPSKEERIDDAFQGAQRAEDQ